MAISDAELAIAAAQRGAAVVRSMFGTSMSRVAKSHGDFATAADVEAERAILDLLRGARPEDAVIAEESGRSGVAGERTWLVDPLCGTLNFAARTMLVSVNVALRTGSTVTAAAAADPFSGEVYWTGGGPGTVRRDGVDERLVPSAESRLVELNLDPLSPEDPPVRTARLLVDPRFVERYRPRAVSTSLAVAWVAAGRRAAYVTDGHLQDSVHFASGIAVCAAAGCVVTGVAGQPLHTGAGGLLVAADRETHATLLAILDEGATGSGSF
jgi:myo-inositol-1(or 4)-monophosphatase